MTVPASLSDIPDVTPYIQYIATASQTVFPYPFPITQDADLVVLVNGVPLATDSGYTVSGVGNDTGGNITFSTGRAVNDIVILYRDIPIERLSQISQNSGFSSELFNAEYNNIYLIMQQLEENVSRCLQLPRSNSPVVDPTLLAANYANKYLSFDANGNPTPAALTASGTLTQALIASLLTPQTTREAAAGVTPVNLYLNEGMARRYNVTGDGSTNDTTAVNNTFLVGYQGVEVSFEGWMVCRITSLTLNATNKNVPPRIRGNGAQLKAAGSASGTLLTIENPHSTWPAFSMDQLVINANSVCSTAMEIHGSQSCSYSNMDFIKSTGVGLYVHGESGFGVYNNTFTRCRAGYNGNGNGTYGIYEYGTGPTYYCNANNFINCTAQYNTTDGWHIDYAQNSHFGCDAEQNSGYGLNVDHTLGMSWYGGYLENNHGQGAITFSGAFTGGETSATLAAAWNGQTSAASYTVLFSNGDSRVVTLTNGATTATWSVGLSGAATANGTLTTLDMTISANTGGFWFSPDRVAPVVNGADNSRWQTSGNMYAARGALPGFYMDLNGRLSVQDIRLRTGGISFNNATPVSNGIGCVSSADFSIVMSGSTKLLWDHTNTWWKFFDQIATTAGGVFGTVAAIDATAYLEVRGTAKGFLPPRMTTGQKNSISTPTEGLIVYDSTLHKLCVRTASAWETVTSA